MSKYVSIQEVLKRLSTLMPDTSINPRYMEAWAFDGLRKLNLEAEYEQAVYKVDFDNHEIPLADDLVHVLGVLVGSAKDSRWVMAKKHTGVLPVSCSSCPVVYQLSTSRILLSVKSGTAIVAYLRYRVGEDGKPLVIDDPVVLEALVHWVLYNHYLQMSLRGKVAADMLNYHLSRWQILSVRAKSVSLPDIGSYENLRRLLQWTFTNSTQFAQTFASLNATSSPV